MVDRIIGIDLEPETNENVINQINNQFTPLTYTSDWKFAVLNLKWWMYALLAVTVFLACLFLNYIAKKFNEARIEERFIRLRQKTSTSQSTQVQVPLIEMETAKASVICQDSKIEDKKDLDVKVSDVITPETISIDDPNPLFLGKIYKEIKCSYSQANISNKVCVDLDSIIDEILDRATISPEVPELKSTQSCKKIVIQNKEDIENLTIEVKKHASCEGLVASGTSSLTENK